MGMAFWSEFRPILIEASSKPLSANWKFASLPDSGQRRWSGEVYFAPRRAIQAAAVADSASRMDGRRFLKNGKLRRIVLMRDHKGRSFGRLLRIIHFVAPGSISISSQGGTVCGSMMSR